MFDFDTLTLGEVASIEDLSGQSISNIAEADAPKGKALAAIVMVIKRRTGSPDFKFNQALAMPLTEANALLGLGAEETDDEGEDDASEPSVTV